MVFAHAAFALVFFLVAELQELGRGAPDFGKGFFAHLAAVEVQVAAGLHLAHGRDEAEARATQAAARHGVHAEGIRGDGDAFGLGPLAHDPVVVGGAGGLQVHARGFAEVVEPVEHLFVFLGRDDLGPKLRGPARGHEQENVPGGGAELFGEPEYLLEVGHVVLGDRGVDLELHPGRLQVVDAAQRPFEGAGHAPEGVVVGGRGRVDGDRAAGNARRLDFLGVFRGDQGPVGGHDAAQVQAPGMAHEVEDVRAQQRLAAGKDDDRVAGFGEGVDERLGVGGIELARPGIEAGLGPAVFAGQVAGPGHFPGDEPQGRSAGRTAGAVGMTVAVSVGMLHTLMNRRGAAGFPPWRELARSFAASGVSVNITPSRSGARREGGSGVGGVTRISVEPGPSIALWWPTVSQRRRP